jgi:hypothetical protein
MREVSYNILVHRLQESKVMTEASYNILTEFGVHMKLVRMTKMRLNAMYGKVHIGKHLSDSFPI